MMPYAFAAGLMTLVWMTIIYLNETRGLLSCDHFKTVGAKYFAYGWLGLFLRFRSDRWVVTGTLRTP